MNLATPCYTVDGGRIVEGTLADFSRYIETTTRPTGVGYKYYATTVSREVERDSGQFDEDGCAITRTVEVDVWVLAKWASWAGPEVVVREFESEEAARAAAETIWVRDILGNPEIMIYLDRTQAERDLRDND